MWIFCVSMAGICSSFGLLVAGKIPHSNIPINCQPSSLSLSLATRGGSLCAMATILSFQSITSHRSSTKAFRPNCPLKICRIRCRGDNPVSDSPKNQESKPENALLKVAWYGSELLGIAASFLRSPSNVEAPERAPKLARDVSGAIDRAMIVETIKKDFGRSYFVTGNLTLDAYEEKCEFADPAGSFKGLGRFKRNCTNFGSLVGKSHMKLTKWEDFEDRGVGHWKFSCILSFPWRPILSATGYTEYYFDAASGKVCRHIEHWNVPKMALLKQILRPTRGWFWLKSGGG